MNLDSLNKWLTLSANIGVIAGIILLAVELNQNNELLKSEARYNLQFSRAEELRQIAENEDLMKIWFKAGVDIELTADERNRLFGMLVQRFVHWEWYYEQYRGGLIRFENIPIKAWQGIMESSERRKIWDSSVNLFTPEFVEFMNENVL